MIAMVKRSSKIRYRFEAQMRNIKELYASCRERRGRSKYLLSLTVQICVADESLMDARIVCVRSRVSRKDWIALITTDMKLSEEDIIRIYPGFSNLHDEAFSKGGIIAFLVMIKV